MPGTPKNDSMHDDDFSLVVAFDRDDTEFARGVEVGVLYQRLRTEPGPLSAVVHTANAEMALRLAEALGRPVRAVELGEDWLEVTYP